MEVENNISINSNNNNEAYNDSVYTILYLNNPDIIYYHDLDNKIKKEIQDKGLKVISAELADINFEIKTDKIDLFINNNKIEIDGFLSYGYMSDFHYEAFLYIIQTFDTMGIPFLHSPDCEKTLSNKYLQALKFSKAKIPIPATFQGYSVEAFKHLSNRNFTNKISILKLLEDYGGEGVKQCESKEKLVSGAAKLLWKNEYSIFQDYISDSAGRSIRVLCINNKAVAIAEYVDKTNSFISNISYGEFFELKSLMEDANYSKYATLGENACKSIGNLMIGGVDILDSKEKGLVVLEVNGFPDIFDITHSTKLNILELLCSAFKEKVIKNKKQKQMTL